MLVSRHFRSVLLGNLILFFSESHDFLGAMSARGFCNVKQKERDIRH